jgi:glycine betaine/choline ABC-type transport system substrate-binding protein
MKKTILVFMILALLLSACSSNEESKKLVIASKPMTEQYIITEMMKTLIEENSHIEVVLKQGIGGGTSNIHPALLSGDIDIYPEYTGTAWMFVLKNAPSSNSDEMYEELKIQYEEEFQLEWLNLLGFNNTFALAIKDSLAKEMNIETYSDLSSLSDKLRFGGEYDFFEREDGFHGLRLKYGFDFLDVKEMDIGLKYMAVDQGEVDVINGFSTDGRLKEYGMKVLRDDKNFFPSYHCGIVMRKDVLERYPEIRDILMKMEMLISEEDMIRMNYLVEVEGKDIPVLARNFLSEKGLIE